MITKILASAILCVHAVAHLPGFISALGTTRMTMSRPVSLPAGIMWLVATVLLLVASGLFFAGRYWGHVGLIAVVISQILVVLWWRDARLGTIMNALIVVPALLNAAAWKFRTTAMQEAAAVMAVQGVVETTLALPEDLPAPVKRWLQASGAMKAGALHTVRLKQKGKMRLDPAGKWLGVAAEQYFNAGQSSFLWLATIDAGMYTISGKDIFVAGKGKMLIKVGALVTVANASGPELDQGAMLRYLAEIQWFPQAALSEHIVWEAINDSSARATFSVSGKSVSGIFYFNSRGDVTAFEARRYMERKGKYSLETWCVPVTAYAVFGGVRVPSRGNAVWKLKDGDFNWFRWEVTEISYNAGGVY